VVNTLKSVVNQSMRTYSEFLKTLSEEEPNQTWSAALKALWYDAKGNWHTAHEIVDGSEEANAKWVHAYLHRKEGDEWNAEYWYRQVNKSLPKITIDEELQEIVEFILNQ